MISEGEKEKQRKDLNKFIQQNVRISNKISLHKGGAAAGGRRPPFCERGGQRPPRLFCLFLGHFVQWIYSGPFFAFPFPLFLSSEGELISFMNDWMKQWKYETIYQLARIQHNKQQTITGLSWHGGVWKGRFQQWDTTHSGTGEKETHNINIVGIKHEDLKSCWTGPRFDNFPVL